MKGRPEMIPPAFPNLPTEMTLKILSNLDNRSLFSCRLVSRGWCQVSSIILQDRSSVTVRTRCDSGPEDKKSLSNLIKCFRKSRKFHHPCPYTNFVLRGEYELDMSKCPVIETLFALSKQSSLLIKSLVFESLRLNQAMQKKLQLLIFEGAPNLRKLGLRLAHVEDFQEEKEAFNKENSAVEARALPLLKILQLDDCDNAAAVKLVTNILRAAPNLQSIVGFGCGTNEESLYMIRNVHRLQPLIDANKLHLVNKCVFRLRRYALALGLVTREKLSGFQPKLLELDIGLKDHELQQVKSCPRDLLWTVKDAVEELTTDSKLGLLDNLDLIRFSKLRIWSIACRENPIFPPGMRNRDPFPCLENISIFFGIKEGERRTFPSWRNSPILAIPSVHNLEKMFNFPFECQEDAKGCFESMARMCPKTRNLELVYPFAGTIDFTCVAPHIWTTMSKLQTLRLRYPRRETGQNLLEKLETGFTGFSVETVRRLKATRGKRRPKVEKVEHLRVNPSILQMTELKKLIINKELLRRSQACKQAPLFPLSFKYAFDLLPELVVQLQM